MGRSEIARRAASALLLLGMAGCTVGPDFKQPAPFWSPTSWFGNRQPRVPKGALFSQPTSEPIDPNWWAVFRDPELTSLEQRVSGGNFDVRTAVVRLAESRASLGVTRADLLPQFNANGSYTREQESKNGVIGLFGGGGGSGGGGGGASTGAGGSGSPGTASNGLGGIQGGVPNTSLTAPFDLYQYGFDASWEVDFWGRVKREIEGSQAQLQASAEAQRDTLLSSSAELARDYIQLRGVQRNLQITRDNLATAQRSLDLTRMRQQGGLGSDLDVANAAAQVANTQSLMPDLQAQEITLTNAIALLLGQPPDALTAELQQPKPIPLVPPRVPLGLPGELARRRPDIRQAEAQLHAATADVGVAVADFYPRVTLSGSVALQATQLKHAFDIGSNTYSLGPSVTLPIFQGGRLRRTLELRQGQQQEAAIAYQRTVLGALHDVNNALTNYLSEQNKRAALAAAVKQNQKALQLSRDQYTQGLETFLNVLDAERQVLTTQQQLNNSLTAQATDLVQIYKALGGGWEQVYPDKAERVTNF